MSTEIGNNDAITSRSVTQTIATEEEAEEIQTLPQDTRPRRATVAEMFQRARSSRRLTNIQQRASAATSQLDESVTTARSKHEMKHRMRYAIGEGAELALASTSSSSTMQKASSTESNKSIQEEEPPPEEPEEEEATSASPGSTVVSYEEEEVEEEEPRFVSVFERLDVEREVLDQPDPITVEMLKAISVDLGQIRLCWPKREKIKIDFMPNVILPDGYLLNTNKEKVLLLYTENFRVQYHTRFPNRKPLLLCGDNVAGQRKMVCTTLRPTTLPHPNLSTWQELASFVADHIKYEPLDPPNKLLQRRKLRLGVKRSREADKQLRRPRPSRIEGYQEDQQCDDDQGGDATKQGKKKNKKKKKRK